MADITNSIKIMEDAIKELGISIRDVQRLIESDSGFDEMSTEATQLSFWLSNLNEKIRVLKENIKDIGKGNIGWDKISNEFNGIKDLYKDALNYVLVFSEMGGTYKPISFDKLLDDDNKKKIEEIEAQNTRALKEKAQAQQNYIKNKNKEAEQIDNIKSKLNEYNQILGHTDTQGLDKVLKKLEIYNREIDKAIQNNDVVRTKNIFGLYQDTFGSISGIQKAQDIGAKRRAQEEAERIKQEREIAQVARENKRKTEQEQAQAEAEAQRTAKEQATAQNNYLNKKNEEAKTIDNIKSKMYEYNQQLAHTDTTGLDKVIAKLGIYNREIDKAIQNNDVARASNIFNLYENQFGSIAGIKKGQQIASNEEAKRQAELAREKAATQKQAEQEAAKATADAVKAQADAQKQWEEQVNKVRNKISEVTGYIKQAIANTVKIIREANSIVNRSISLMISVFDKLGSTVQRIISLFGNFGDRLKAHTKQGNILKGTYTELKSKIDLLVGAFNKLFNNQFINEGKKLLSSVQTLNMLIGTELTSKTMEWANNLEHAFGLSASGLIADLKEITAVMYGLGMSSKNVQIAATNLEAVAMSLSATTGYDFSTVINKIQSGMKGMTQSIDDLGLSVRESQMDAFLKKLKAQGGEYANIGTSFSQLTEQQRIYVRYAAIMDQFTSKSAYSAENYSKSLRTITGGLSVLNSQLRGLKSELGSLALQLFSKIIQPLIYIIYLVRRAVAWVAKLLNIDLTLNPLMNGGEENVIPIEDEANALNDLADAADKAKGSLDSLDHVSTLSSSSDKNKDKFDYSSLMNISDDYAKVLEELGKLQDDFIEECKRKFWEMLNEIKDRFTNWVKEVTGRVVDWDKIKENFEKIKENFKQTLENMKRIAKAAFNIIGGLLYSVFDDLDSTDILAKFTTTIEKFTGLVATILEKIQPYIQNFYDKYLSKYVIKFGDWIEAKLDSINSKLDEWQKHWDNVGENDPAIIAWFDELGRKVEKVIKFIKEIFIVFKALFGFKFSEKDTFDVTQMSDGMKSTLGIAHDLHYTFLDILDIITKTATKIFDFNGSGSLDLGDLEIALGKIKDKLDEIRQFIEDNKEPISNLLSETVITVSTLAAAKFDIIMQLIEMIVNNADTISSILRGLQDLIKWASENPKMAIGISIAGQTGFSVGKSLLTAYMWKKLLGLGAGGAAEMAAGAAGVTIGSKILAGIKGAILPWMSSGAIAEAGAAGAAGGTNAVGAGTVLATLGSTIGVAFGNGLGIATGIAGIREGFNDVIDGVNDTTYAIDNWIHRLRGENEELRFTSDNYKTFAYEVRRALTEVYGKDIDTSKAQRAFEIYAQDLQKTYNLTDEETESLVRNIERQYNRLSTSLDGALSTTKYSTDYSKNNIIRLADSFRTLDEKQTQTSDVSKKTSNSIKEDTKKSSDAIKTNVDSSVNSIETLNTSFEDSIANLKKYKDDTRNEWSSINSIVSGNVISIQSKINTLNTSFKNYMSMVSSNPVRAAQTELVNKTGWNPKRIRGFATGGLPRSGSLFMANENGNTELVGNFGGYSGVANQNMIIEAMQNAMVQAIRSAGGIGNGGTTNNYFQIGNWLGDDASIRKLAKQLNNANARSNSNIANTGFVMS